MERRAALAVGCLVLLAACEGPRLRPVTGDLQISPAVLDFGARAAGSRTTLTVTLTNSGKAPAPLSARLERDARGAFSLGEAPALLEAGAQVTLPLTYVAPLTEGADGVSLVLESDTELVLSVAARSTVTRPPPSSGCPGAPPTVAVPASAPWPGSPRLAWNGAGNLLTQVSSPADGSFMLEALTLSTEGALGRATRLLPSGLDGRAVFTGDGYGLISWRWLSPTGAEVVFTRLTPQGTLISGSERRLPRTRDFQTDAALAWNPLAREWGVLWHEWNNGEPMVLRFARLDEAGALLDGSLVELGAGLIDGSGSMLTWGGGAFVALQQRGGAGGLRLVRLDETGASFTTLADGVGFHAQNVAWNGADYGLLWVETLGGTASVNFARANRSGALIEGSRRTLHAFPFLEAPTADLVASGTGWLATWAATPVGARGDIFVVRVAADGELEGGAPVQLSCEPSRDGFPVASTGGRPTAVAFTHFGEHGSEVRTALIP